MWHTNRGRLLLRTPGPVTVWDLRVFKCWDQSLLNLSSFQTFEFRTSLDTSVLLPCIKYEPFTGFIVRKYIQFKQFRLTQMWLSLAKTNIPLQCNYAFVCMYVFSMNLSPAALGNIFNTNKNNSEVLRCNILWLELMSHYIATTHFRYKYEHILPDSVSGNLFNTNNSDWLRCDPILLELMSHCIFLN